MSEYEIIKKKVNHIISEYTDIEIRELTDEKKIVADLGFSSFDVFFLISEIEKNFKIQININDEFSEINTLKELYQFVFNQLYHTNGQKDGYYNE